MSNSQEFPRVNFTIVEEGCIITLLLCPSFSMNQTLSNEAVNSFVKAWIAAKLAASNQTASADDAT